MRRCGTKPDMHGQFYENTVVVQYDKDLLEVWDEAKRLRCEWFNDYEKTASKPPMVIADLDVIQLDFRGTVFPLSSTLINATVPSGILRSFSRELGNRACPCDIILIAVRSDFDEIARESMYICIHIYTIQMDETVIPLVQRV